MNQVKLRTWFGRARYSFVTPESFERQLGDRVTKRLKSPRAPFRCGVLSR
jgi:hypothetical protein